MGVSVVRVESAIDMRDSLIRECRDAHILVMAAAVADWRPADVSERKIKKGSAGALSLELTRTPDAVADIGYDGLIKVGFAAETDDVERNARAKIAPRAYTSSPPTTSPTRAAASAPTPTASSS